MIYDVIQSWVVLTEKFAFFNKNLEGVYGILNHKINPALEDS